MFTILILAVSALMIYAAFLDAKVMGLKAEIERLKKPIEPPDKWENVIEIDFRREK